MYAIYFFKHKLTFMLISFAFNYHELAYTHLKGVFSHFSRLNDKLYLPALKVNF